MSPKELYAKSELNSEARIERATEFLIRLKDMLSGRLDSFETGLFNIIVDEYMELIKDRRKRQ